MSIYNMDRDVYTRRLKALMGAQNKGLGCIPRTLLGGSLCLYAAHILKSLNINTNQQFISNVSMKL